MRRSGLASALVMIALALGTVVGLATSASAQSVSGSDCATKKFRILFWPKGHPAVPSAGFPAFPTPHVEVYTGTGKKFPDTQEVGYIDATHATVSSKSPCTATTSMSTNGTQNKKVTKTKEVDCTFKASPVLIGGQISGGGGALIIFSVNGKPGATVSISPTAGKSLVSYDSKQCKVKAAPK